VIEREPKRAFKIANP